VMRRLLYTSGITAAAYAVLASLIVAVSALFASSVWVAAVSYIGPVMILTVLLWLNWSAFDDVSTPALKWLALVGSCAVIAAAISFCIFVLAVNLHLVLGGRI
jgi:hypothetical protein